MTPHQILTLARVPNLPTVWSNVLMAWVVAGGLVQDQLSSHNHVPAWVALSGALLGGTLLYAGGCTLNDACDARWDRTHKPGRLIPGGILSERAVWNLGIGQMAGGLLFFLTGGTATWYLPAALILAILFYDFRHKETPWSVITMGSCRALLVLSAAGVAGGWQGWLQWQVLTAAAVLWIYIITLSLLARRESRPGGSLLRTLRPAWSVGRWVGEMLAAIPLVDAVLILALRPAAWPVAVICLALWPLCRLLQRKYAAT